MNYPKLTLVPYQLKAEKPDNECMVESTEYAE